MKTSYRAAASLTNEENLIAIDRFIANTAIFIKRTNNRYTPVRSSTALTQVGLELLQQGQTSFLLDDFFLQDIDYLIVPPDSPTIIDY